VKRILVLFIALAIGTSSAHAEPWYRGKYGRNRVVHLSASAALGVAFLLSETTFKADLAADKCRWCEPPIYDREIRKALVWDDTKRANFLSNMDAYVVAPIVGIGLLVLSESDASPSRVIDDALPVMETVAITQVITQAVKFSVGRQRPDAHFRGAADESSNLSFWSGHSALGFGITASAGWIAHRRGYWTEPYIWAAGITLSVSTEYLRMAADRHYFSDVLIGGGVGIAGGFLIPRLMDRDIKIVPVANGAALAGSW